MVTIEVEGVPIRIYVPRPIPGTAGARAEFEVVILGRCGYEECGRVIDCHKTYCDDTCRYAHNNLQRKLAPLRMA